MSVHLSLFFSKGYLPLTCEWESIAKERNISLKFPDGFELKNHIEGDLTIRLFNAKCSFSVDVSALDTLHPFHEPLDEFGIKVWKSCDMVTGFRWSEANRPAELGAMLSLGTLAILTQGVVPWRRAQGGYCEGEDAFKRVSRSAYNSFKRAANINFDKADPFGPSQKPEILKSGNIRCPRCSITFSPNDSYRFDGEKHLSCGQKLDI